MRLFSFIALCLVTAFAFQAVAQPSSSVVENLKLLSVARDETSYTNYKLRGEYVSTQADGQVVNKILYEIIEAGGKFRWDFKGANGEEYLAAYDGAEWFNKARNKDSSGKWQETGNVLENPQKTLGEDPRDAYTNGFLPIYPITLAHLAEDPFRVNDDENLASRLLKHISHIESSEETKGQERFVNLRFDSEIEAERAGLPRSIQFKVFPKSYVLTRVQNIPTEPGTEGYAIHYRKHSELEGVIFPSEISKEVFMMDDNGKLKKIGESKIAVAIEAFGPKSGDKSLFQAKFSPGTLVFKESEQSGVVIPGLDIRGSSLLIASIGGLLILAGVSIVAMRRRQRRA